MPALPEALLDELLPKPSFAVLGEEDGILAEPPGGKAMLPAEDLGEVSGTLIAAALPLDRTDSPPDPGATDPPFDSEPPRESDDRLDGA